ncbi:cytosol nonspecific dipeptidase [Prosthecochloris sp. GSB1]|uniref:aminoacyl-histidine dipeptidase n=1 Tax=Prosthecochloris sp. GSB1 TaxID=281093 RepID=UPI000B8CE784|nr:aminoacyl-histidine dipeptidase [Prosthecochloris sp. GSB1]ASQ91660.1 cytosol nonspecific dipeptidase [Prosthecochloris sp. GSB1]
MSNDISSLHPVGVWKHFQRIARIPRPSGGEARIREFVVGFGASLGLETIVDDAGNVIIRKPAVAGMEDRVGIILQAHLDMVPQKIGGIEHDFENDPIEAVVDGEWVRASGTTLGADNGIGVAAILAVLESPAPRHGPLEALFTANEENGMSGAFGLRPGLLGGGILLNLDSEDEGELFIGCAGGLDATVKFDFEGKPLPLGYNGFVLTVGGLSGGHSGMDIHLGRGNANKIMNRLLQHGRQCHGLLLSSVEGGSLRNAIPRESSARVAVPRAGGEAFLQETAALAETINNECSATDPELSIAIEKTVVPSRIVDESAFAGLLEAISACPDGVVRMSGEIPGLVETSSNLAVVRSADGFVTVECLLRSSADSALQELGTRIGDLFRSAGASVVLDGGYPGWKPNPESRMLGIMRRVYRDCFGKVPALKAVHAGLECGIIGATYPKLDMVSFGPTIRHPHSPYEKVDIASVEKFHIFLEQVLASAPTVLS